MEIEDALRRCGDAARWSQLRTLGVSEHALRAAVAAGRLAQPHPGTYVLPGADPAIAAAVGLSGVVSHASAARLHGLDLYEPPQIIEVTVRRGCRQRARGVRVYPANVAPEETEINQPITTVRRTVRDCVRTMPLLHGVVLLDGVVRDERLCMADLRTMAAEATGPGSTTLRRAVGHVDAMSGSGLETILRLLLELLPVTFETQVWIDGVGLVDILVNGWLILEADGFAFHSNREHYRRDRKRGNGAAERRLGQLRFTWEDLHFRRSAVLQQIVRVLEADPRG
ncbi:type IV toxin-antitoxin system AbiEi family antitoxin domain-containing protein [Sporichthya sp.]|uniref:type IV toxin-antitoxin system AbiEi family antitoxin domain-containing protein n=1 Tax=Sporichthya sp. TaxID=65475 RepID=UPI0017DE78F6|nr:type IV toxin-antitoxin system AbiEi family antitoxin domain-containing protein [Sporichthya sp.]MBA3743534.1 type IV toxin-antitoxin system AbiEi family antitoxin domain-containing protein [Sporichthya sp.]